MSATGITTTTTTTTRLLKDAEVADRLGICRAQVHRLRQQGMPSHQFGRARRYDLDECMAWADEQAAIATVLRSKATP